MVALSILDWLEEEMATVAPSARQSSATAKPIPEVPPRMRTFCPESFEVGMVVEFVVVQWGFDDGGVKLRVKEREKDQRRVRRGQRSPYMHAGRLVSQDR